MADDIREARRLAKLVWPGGSYIPSAHGSFSSWYAATNAGIDGGPIRVFAPTRRAALTGLCAALRAMTGEGGK